jgi:curved DNA-binding protein CbpA
MLTINEAWEILSNPLLRSKYDRARQANASTATMTEAVTDVQNARRRAENYPRKWADFQKWMDSVLDDFSGAEYSARSGLYGVRWPSAKNSISGKLFIIIGGIAGFIIGILLLAALEMVLEIRISDIHPLGAALSMVFAALGAWVGRVIHGLIGSALKHN